MQIDNVREAQDLSDRLEATIPFLVRIGTQLLKTMLDSGNHVSIDDFFTVDWVKYSGDVGGINCAFEEPDSKQRYVVSITHIKSIQRIRWQRKLWRIKRDEPNG
jgi:hypothetical protein